jgi:hypothetical protein
MWAFIDESDSVELFDTLPKNWRNISNFSALESDTDALRSLSWYPVLEDIPDFDPYTQVRSEVFTAFDEENNVVIRTATVTDKSQDQLDLEHNERRQAFILDIRARRDRLLTDSDWTQAADVQAAKSDEWKQSWIEYRQWLRDLPEICANPPYNLITDSNQVAWRSPPG